MPISIIDGARQSVPFLPACFSGSARKCFRSLALGLFALLLSNAGWSQNADFNVTVNLGPLPPNSGTVYPGEATSLRVTLSNNSTVIPLTSVGYSKALPTNASNGLQVNGASSISGDAGCVGGTLTTTAGLPGITLAGLTIPVRQLGVPGSGECYLDVPVVAVSNDGASGSLSYLVGTGEVSSDQGVNATGGPQAYTLRSALRPTWSKAFVGNNILVVGGAFRTMRITVNNPDSNVDLTGIAFTDIFPTSGAAGAIMQPTGLAAMGTCVAMVGLTSGSAAQVAVSDLDITAGSSCTVEVEVQGTQTDGVYQRNGTNILATSSFSSDQGLQPASNASASVRVRSPLAVTKSFNPTIVASGQPATFNVRLTNSAFVPIPVTSFTDDPIAASPFSDRLNIAVIGDVVNSCAGSTSALENGGEGFTVSGFSIPAGSFCDIDVTYTGITPGNDEPTTYTNQIGQGDVITTIPGVVSQSRSATVLVADRLRVLKSGSPANAAPGDAVQYTVIVQNFSNAAITNASVVDNLQNGSTLLLGGSFTPTVSAGCGTLGVSGAQGDSSVTFTIPNIGARTGNTPGVCTLTFSAMLDPAATTATSNSIGIGGVCFGSGPPICNSVASGNVSTANLDTLTLAKTIDGVENASGSEGSAARMRLQVDNESTAALTGLTFSDTFPVAGPFQQLQVATPPNISNTCGGTITAVGGSTSLSLNSGTVPAQVAGTPGTCAVEVDVVAPAGVYPNSADASALRHNSDGTTTVVNDTDTATVTFTDALQTTKSFGLISVGDNGTATASIRFTSLDPTKPITGISVIDDLPAGMSVATPGNSYTTCSGPTSVMAMDGAVQVSLTGATLVPLASCEVRFNVSATGTTDWVNTIPAGGVTADGGLTNRNPVSATLFYVPPQVPLISKSISPGTIVPGQSALLTISLTNGIQAITELQIADYFTLDGASSGVSNGMRLAASPQATTDCVNGIVTAAPEGEIVRLSGASMAPSSACEVLVRVTSTTVGTLTNTIPMNSITTDQGATNSTSFAQSTLSTTSAVGVSKQFEPPMVSPTQPARLRISIYNSQSIGVTGLALTDVFPAGLVVAPTPNPFSDCGGSVAISFPDTMSVMMTGGSLSPAIGNEASVCVIETDVVAAAEGSYPNVIPADSLTANGNPVPHPGTAATLEVRERMLVNKAIDDFILDMGDPVGFTTGVAARLPSFSAPLTIRIENPNNIALTQVRFIDTLPDGLVLANPTNLTTDCTGGSVVGVVSGREIRLAGATLAASGNAGDICTVTADVVSNIPGIYTNEIAAGEVVSFEGIDNDPGTQAQIIIVTPPGLTKDIAPPVIPPNGPATLTLVLENENDLSYTLSNPLVDNLPTSPDQMVVAAPSVISTDCPGGNGIVTATAGASTVTIATAAVVPAGGCMVTVEVTAATAGDYFNHIPVAALDTSFGFNESEASAPMKVSTLGYISGRVFLDNQAVPDGTYLPGDSTPIEGNMVELRSGVSCGGALLDSVPTDVNGNYLFSDLVAGIYSVCQPTQPAGSLNSFPTAGIIIPYMSSTGTPGSASNPGGGTPTSQVATIVLNDNGTADEVSGSPENNFSEVLPVSISGNVYYDENGNGLFDPSESGIGGTTVILSGPVNTSVLTNADGSYSFVGLLPGDYTLVETQPSPWADGLDTLGTVDGAPVGDGSVDDTFSSITLVPGEDGIEYNFGETLSAAALAINTSGFCDNQAPRVSYDIPAFSGGGAPPITLRWITVDDRLVQQLTDQPPSGILLWPGAEVDGGGVGIAWPGWMLQGVEWVRIADDRVPDMILRVTAGSSAETLITYPENEPPCLTQPPGTLPRLPVPTTPVPALWLLVLMLASLGYWSIGGLTRQRF